MNRDKQSNHLPSSITISDLWRSGEAMILPIHGTPSCQLKLQPNQDLISLLTAPSKPAPDVSRMKHLSYKTLATDAGAYGELSIKAGPEILSAYGVLSNVVELIQDKQYPLDRAVATVITSSRYLMETKSPLGLNAQVGLYGELLFLKSLADMAGIDLAIASWTGPAREEHDFSVGTFNVEVKSTLSEKRLHRIHGISQLTPTPGSDLYVLSIQLTRGAPPIGRTLANLIDEIQHTYPTKWPTISSLLRQVGWDDRDQELYDEVLTPRTQPRSYLVDNHFPAITTETIDGAVPNAGAIGNLSYDIDLTNLLDHPLPVPFSDVIRLNEEF